MVPNVSMNRTEIEGFNKPSAKDYAREKKHPVCNCFVWVAMTGMLLFTVLSRSIAVENIKEDHFILPQLKHQDRPIVQREDCLPAVDFGAEPVPFGTGGNGLRTRYRENTQAIHDCLDEAVMGCCYLSGGDFYVSDIFLRSHTTLFVDETARLVSTFNQTKALVWAQEVTNASVVGGGTLYGNAEYYIDYYDDQYKRFEPFLYFRPKVVFLNESSYVWLHNISAENSSDWTIHIKNSFHVFIDHVNVYGDRLFPNNDGIDPDSSSYVTISNCRVDVADDGICVSTVRPRLPRQLNHFFFHSLKQRILLAPFGI